jgi:hypothetical protein
MRFYSKILHFVQLSKIIVISVVGEYFGRYKKGYDVTNDDIAVSTAANTYLLTN